MKKIFLNTVFLFGICLSGCTSDIPIEIQEEPITQEQAKTMHEDEVILLEDTPIAHKETEILRGFNWGWWNTAQPGDASEAKSFGANTIRIPFRWYFSGKASNSRQTDAPGHIDPEKLKIIDQNLDWCADAGMHVIFFAGSDFGAGDAEQNFWTDEKLRTEFFETWQFLTDRYQNRDEIFAFEILSEPHPNVPATEVKQFYAEGIAAIREIDPKRKIIIGPPDRYDIAQLESVWFPEVENLWYTFNYYLPKSYTHTPQRKKKNLPLITYPGTITIDRNKEIFDRNLLKKMLIPALDFRTKTGETIFINQVGVRSEAPGHLEYLRDVLEIFDENKTGWTYWTYRTRSDANEHGLYWRDADENYHLKTDQLEILKSALQK